MHGQTNTKLGRKAGFTLLELLVVIAIIAILAALLLPGLVRAKMRAQRTACLNNLSQLSLACKMYADDSGGQLVSSWPVGTNSQPVNPYSWCPGWASTQPQNPEYGPAPQYSATNIYALQQGAIWPYVKTASIYRCPADNRTVGGLPVVRSYSMNSWLAGKTFDDPSGVQTTFDTPDKDGLLTYTFFRQENQILQPVTTWSLIDEDGSTINDSMFLVDIGPVNGVYDLPGTHHGSAYEIGFVDGHMESVKWQADSSDWDSQPPDPDWQNLKGWTTIKK
jgi:prepilin-type N-terminal cleavage/methylation domain-containing protein